MDSPFDLSNYLAFPSAHSGVGQTTNPSSGNMSQPNPHNGPNGHSGGMQPGGQGHDGVPSYNQGMNDGSSAGHAGPAGNPELYMAFARGIHEHEKGRQQGQIQQQQQQQQQQQRQSQQTSQPPSKRSPMTHQTPGQNGEASDSGTTNSGSGSNGNLPTPNTTAQGYGLDPSAFQSEVKFQLPAFLNPTASAPTYPGGAEAFSGYGINSAEAMGNVFGGFVPNNAMNGGNSQSDKLTNAWTLASARVNEFNQSQQQQQMFGSGDAAFGLEQNGSSAALQPWESWAFRPGNYTFNSDRSMTVQSMNKQQTQQFLANQAQSRGLGQAGNGRPAMGNRSGSSQVMPTSALLPAPGSANNFSSGSFPSSSNDPAADLIANANLGGLVQPGTLAAPPPPSTGNMPGLYSTTGFDMIGVLSRVAARRHPKTVLGPVDCSCSFLVVDIRRFDSPIVYASPTFCNLTGYESHEIVGKNCRFLQSPNGEVVKGSRRKYTDNAAVFHLKRMLEAGKECQASLINYRKGGMPFINLVTVVPIPWDTEEIVYHVGFQVDLVEQPNAILRNMRDGSYQVNYTVTPSPAPALKPPPPPKPPAEPVTGLASIEPELFQLLPKRSQNAVYNGPEDSGKMEWLKFVFENTDDFVHVLSLKGQFHYVSPSVRNVLEYEPEDLMNKHISDICHPSDIVPVMRELKDSTHTVVAAHQSDSESSAHVSLVFRVRRKYSGYCWLECQGRLHVEAGKGRKAVILTGREHSLSAIMWKTVQEHGGLGEVEFWGKVSFDGLFLWASSTVTHIMGTTDLIGKSMFDFVSDPKPLVRALRQAASGQPRLGAVSVTHSLMGRQVMTTFYSVNLGDVDLSTDSPNDASGISTAETPSSSAGTTSTDSRSPSVNSRSLAMGAVPNHILFQVKVVPSASESKRGRPLAHSLSANIFEEMDTTRGTSWQYEMHQLKISNRKLEDEIKGLRNGSFAVDKSRAIALTGVAADTESESASDSSGQQTEKQGKKRKSMSGSSRDKKDTSANAPLPTPNHPAPLHQQTPGFGLAPGALFQSWNS